MGSAFKYVCAFLKGQFTEKENSVIYWVVCHLKPIFVFCMWNTKYLLYLSFLFLMKLNRTWWIINIIQFHYWLFNCILYIAFVTSLYYIYIHTFCRLFDLKFTPKFRHLLFSSADTREDILRYVGNWRKTIPIDLHWFVSIQ